MGDSGRTVGVSSPWLEIPLEDYETHMSLAAVGQAQLIAQQLEESVRESTPASVAVVGCAGGNGFERLVGSGISRVVGIDLNARYVERVRERYGQPNGVLVTLTQLPHESQGHVSVSPYTSLKRLEPAMRLVSSEALVSEATRAGFAAHPACRTIATPAGKRFALHTFRA